MEPTAERLVMYGEPSDLPALDWSWVQDELSSAATYWVVARSEGPPHPRPVWGVWDVDTLYVSVGSRVIADSLQRHPDLAVHLDSGTDVVILEGRAGGTTDDPAVLERYNHKYAGNYTIEQYGPLTVVVPTRVLAWRTAEWAGSGGFQQAGRWRF